MLGCDGGAACPGPQAWRSPGPADPGLRFCEDRETAFLPWKCGGLWARRGGAGPAPLGRWRRWRRFVPSLGFGKGAQVVQAPARRTTGRPGEGAPGCSLSNSPKAVVTAVPRGDRGPVSRRVSGWSPEGRFDFRRPQDLDSRAAPAPAPAGGWRALLRGRVLDPGTKLVLQVAPLEASARRAAPAPFWKPPPLREPLGKRGGAGRGLPTSERTRRGRGLPGALPSLPSPLATCVPLPPPGAAGRETQAPERARSHAFPPRSPGDVPEECPAKSRYRAGDIGVTAWLLRGRRAGMGVREAAGAVPVVLSSRRSQPPVSPGRETRH